MEIFNFIHAQKSYLAQKTISEQDAEDIIQDVYEIVWKKREYFESKPLADQKKIVSVAISNKFIDAWRSRTKKRLNPKLIPKYQPAEAYSIIELKEVVETLYGHERHLQLLAFASGYSTKEIQQALGLKSLNTVTGRNRYARLYLNKQL